MTKNKRDSGGLIIYLHDKLKQYRSFVKSTNECLLWIKLDKCLFNIDSDLFLCLAYNVPKGSTREHLNIYDLIAHWTYTWNRLSFFN